MAALSGLLAGTVSPAGSLIMHSDREGLRCQGRWALAWLAPLGIAMAVAAPALADERLVACNQIASEHMRVILERAGAFAHAHSGHWPRNIEDLRAWAKDLGDP